MAEIKITELNELPSASLNNNDVLPIVDVSDDETKKITAGSIIDIIYPVGSIYMSVNNTSPAVLFGGTWQQIEGRTLVGVGTGTDANNTSVSFTAEQTGGEYTHTLLTNEMPSHSHTLIITATSSHQNNAGRIQGTTGGTTHYNTENMQSTGGDEAHNNIQPFYAVYMWKRTA